MQLTFNLKPTTLKVIMTFAIFSIVVSCSKEDDIVDPGSKQDPVIMQVIGNIKADSIAATIGMLEGMGTRFTLADNRRNVALAIMNRFKSYGYTNARLDSFLLNVNFRGQYYETWQYNVIATLPGVVYPDSITIMGGHHDCILRSTEPQSPFTVAPGADDNASGVAVTLEVARVLKQAGFAPRTTIVFATFAAEELGLFGSQNMTNRLSDTLAKVKFMLNNDMVSFCPVTDSTNWFLNIIDYFNTTDFRVHAQELCSTYTLLKSVNDITYREYSDSYSFYQRGYKPLFFISQHDDPNYHKLTDKAMYQNPRFAREVAKLNCALIMEANK
ncbi:MAG: M20/M25/M40 family metallo-hydrolase [Bacteroidota bacterium]